MRFLLFLGAVVAAVVIFFSGSMPYTLVYDKETLASVGHSGKEPIAAEVVNCEVGDTSRLSPGAPLDTTFRARLRNNTDRFVAISAIGEVFDPKGRSMGMNSQMFVMSPNAAEETSFRSNTPFTTNGTYTCEMRYTVGRFEY